MITQNDVLTANNNPYLDKRMLDSVAVIDALTLAQTQELSSIMKKYNAEVLSKISQLTALTLFILDNMTNMQRDIYIKAVLDSVEDVRNVSFNALPASTLQSIITAMVKALDKSKISIESSYDLPTNSISIYNDANIEQGIDYENKKKDSPIILKYYEGKLFFKKVVSIAEDFTITRAMYDDIDFSEQYSFVDKFSNVLDRNTGAMQAKILLSNKLDEIVDSCVVAECSFAEYSLTTRQSVDLFLGRKYSKIREDILVALKNQL